MCLVGRESCLSEGGVLIIGLCKGEKSLRTLDGRREGVEREKRGREREKRGRERKKRGREREEREGDGGR